MTRRIRTLGTLILAVGFAWLSALAPVRGGELSGTYVNFSFDQADIRLLAKLVGEMTGRRMVIDDNISGKVTVVTPPRIPVEEVYPLFLSILEASGFSVMERDGVSHVVRLPEKGVVAGRVVGAEEEEAVMEGLITKVIRLEHISAIELKKTLEPMVRGGKSGALEAFGPTNHLIITDAAENVRRIEQIIAELDKVGAARVVEFIKLQNASAEDVASQLLEAMRGGETSARAVGKHMDRLAGGTGELPVDVVVVPAPQAKGLVVLGTKVQLGELRRVVQMMDVESDSGYGRLNAIFLKYMPAEEAAKSLNGLLAKTAEKEQRARIAIEPNTPNNALLVDASPQDFEYVRSLVAQLDQVPQQVMVEILIAEVAMGKNLDLGVEWSTIDLPEDGKTTAIGRSRPGEQDDIMNLVKETVFPQGLSVGVARGTYTDASGVLRPRIPVLLRALAQNRDVNILAGIPLRAQNNTEASVSVVENIPILRSTIEGGSGTARDIIQNIDRLDVGIKLKLTPHVNPQREITMQLNPSIEAIVDEGPPDTQFAPSIAKREVSTTVTVPDRSTIIISGLIREDRIRTVRKVPLLGDIPLIGWLFRSTTDSRQRTNLLVFVTPHIVTEEHEVAQVEREIIERSGVNLSVTNALRQAGQTEKK